MATEPLLLLGALPRWSGTDQTIHSGLGIRRLSPNERAALAMSDSLLLYHDIDQTARDHYWLCHEFESVDPAGTVAHARRQEAAFKRMLYATYAIHILLPIGAPNLTLLYRSTPGGPILAGSRHQPPYHGTIWARICDLPDSFAEEIPQVFARVQDAFQKPTLRLQIPIWLLEQGLIAPDRHIRLLLWATGLDGLTRSGGVASFIDRLCSLLGPDAKIFPPCADYARPKYTVADVAGDLYLLRNQMAHGLPFDPKFRHKRGFLAQNDEPVSPDFAAWRYDQVLEECSAFLLCRALREILLHNRTFDVHTGCWSE
jgi:hypothetical protein